MNVRTAIAYTRRALVVLCATSAAATAADRPPVKCGADSPERRGQEGCTILASRPLHATGTTQVYWHVHRFDTLAAAQAAAGPDGVATEAHGAAWLLSVEPRHERHGRGRHVAWIGPLELPKAGALTMRVQSSFLLAGTTTPVHTHSGPEVFFIVDGEQCLETREAGHVLHALQSFVLPAGIVHRGRIAAPGGRRAFGLIIHDAALPASQDLVDAPALVTCPTPAS